MTCSHWRDLRPHEGVDEIEEAARQDLLSHLQECVTCRKLATDADPTLVFSLLPSERFAETEVDDMRRAVRSIRRSRNLETSRNRRVRRGLLAGSVAALFLVALVLMPPQPDSPASPEVPFAGAVGVGSGLVSLPQAATAAALLDLQVELARSPRMEKLSGSPTLQPLSSVRLRVAPGDWVDRDLGFGFRLQFRLASATPPEGPRLTDFRVLQSAEQGGGSLLEADLHPSPNAPLVLGLTSEDQAEGQLWLLLNCAVEAAEAP